MKHVEPNVPLNDLDEVARGGVVVVAPRLVMPLHEDPCVLVALYVVWLVCIFALTQCSSFADKLCCSSSTMSVSSPLI